MRHLLVAGSRGFDSWRQDALEHVLNQASYALDMKFGKIIHGGARGVDRMAGIWAESKGYPVSVYPAYWELHGKRAGYIRNSLMVEDADAAIIVWDGKSKGTKHTIDLMTASGKPYVLVVRPL